MRGQSPFPKSPEEVAERLRQLTENEQHFVNGVIFGLNEARRNTLAPQAERPGA